MTTFIKTKFKISDDQTNITRNWTFVVQTVIWGKYNIAFCIPIKFSSQREEEKILNRSRNNEIMLLLKMPKSSFLNGLLWSFEESTISDLESPSNFQFIQILFANDLKGDGFFYLSKKLFAVMQFVQLSCLII